MFGGLGRRRRTRPAADARQAGRASSTATEADALPDWIGQDEFDHYIAEFTRTGFTGGAELVSQLRPQLGAHRGTAAATITVPALFVGGTADPVLRFTPRDRVREVVAVTYQRGVDRGAGHWVQQERPDEVNEQLLSFLSGLELK